MADAPATGILSRLASMHAYAAGANNPFSGLSAGQDATFGEQADILAQARSAAQQRLQAQRAQMMQFGQAPAPQIAWQMPQSTVMQPMRPMPFRGGLS